MGGVRAEASALQPIPIAGSLGMVPSPLEPSPLPLIQGTDPGWQTSNVLEVGQLVHSWDLVSQ